MHMGTTPTYIHVYAYRNNTYIIYIVPPRRSEDEEYLYRVAKTHRIPYLYRSFSAKVTYI